jgi:acetyl-CoA synthetase
MRMEKRSYDEIYRSFDWNDVWKYLDWKGPELNVAHEYVDRHDSHRVVLFWEDAQGRSAKYTFHEMKVLSNRLANALESLGITKGDRVGLLLPRIPEHWISMIAIWKVGAISVHIFTAFGPDAITYRLNASEAKALITDQANLAKVEVEKIPTLKHIIVVTEPGVKLPEKYLSFWDLINSSSKSYDVAKTRENDVCALFFTSGTTGPPKGVMIPHSGACKWLIPWYIYALGITDKDLHFNTADPAWTYGAFTVGLSNWLFGNPMLVYNGPFDPEAWFRLIQKYGVTTMGAAPTAYRMLVANPELVAKYDLSSLRVLYTGGEPATKELVLKVEKVLRAPLYESYGITEVSMIINNYAGIETWKVKPGSIGRELPGIEVILVDEQGNEVERGEVGEIAIKHHPGFLGCGYWKAMDAWNKKFLRGEYFLSGDLAYMDEDGYYWFTGRADDLIKTAAYRVGPSEIEEVIMAHPDVIEVAVIGKPDPIRGSIIKAFVVARHPSEKLAKEIQDLVRERYSRVAYPREIEFVDSLPKTETGKIMRRVLREMELRKLKSSSS